MPPKPRQQVNDLQGTGQLTPAAQPVDSYSRVGAPEIQDPLQTNPMMKLAESLGTLEPGLTEFTKQRTVAYTKDEIAQGEAKFWANREAANAMIKAGEIPPGASPYAARGFQRAALKQLGSEYLALATQAFTGKEGQEARESNNPAAMRKFLGDVYGKFSTEWLSGGYFSDLDKQEVLTPALEQANAQLMKTHADHRVKEVERQYEDLVSVQADDILTKELGTLNYATSPEDRDSALGRAAAKMHDLRDNKDTGFGANTGLSRRGSELLIDAITTKAMKTGDRSYLEVLDKLTTNEGAPLAKTHENQKKILQTEEHLTAKSIQEERHQWALQDRPFEVASHEHTVKEWDKQQERYDREKKDWINHKNEQEIFHSMSRRLYEGLRMTDSKKGVDVIDGVLRDAEDVIPEQAERLRTIVGAFTQHRADIPEDDLAVLKMRAKISTDPLSVKPDHLIMMLGRTANRKTIESLIGDLDREQQRAGHPFLQQEQFREMIRQVRQGSMNSPDDEYNAEGQVRVTNALGEFRDRAQEWIDTNPKGSNAAFNNAMRDLVPKVLERHNDEYGKTKRTERKKEEDRGQVQVDNTKALVAKRDAIIAERQAKAGAEQKIVDERNAFNKDFQPSGKKTKEGRPILQNAKGQAVSERPITIKGHPEINNGGITNIPTIFNGKMISDEEAIQIVAKNGGKDPETGKALRRYWSVREAEIAKREKAQRLHAEYSHEK